MGLVFGANHAEHVAEGADVLGDQFKMMAAPMIYSEVGGSEHDADGGYIQLGGALDCPDDSLISLRLGTIWGVELLARGFEGLPVRVMVHFIPILWNSMRP